MSRHYYAAYHTHGKNIVNDVAYIVRFGSAAERDAYVNDEVWDGHNYHHEAITASKARSLAPNAFRIHDTERDMRCWVSDGHPGEFFTIQDFC